MKLLKIGILLTLTLLVLVSCTKTKKDPFPSIEEIAGAKAGDLILKAGTLEKKEKQYKAEFGTLIVPENRNKTDSRLIHLPVVRLLAAVENPAEPVFLLTGGPGMSNTGKSSFEWLLKNHDIVMVGYRGVDGSVSLNCPEVEEALKVDKNPLSGENLKKLGNAYYMAFQRLKKEGVDIDRYTMLDVIDDMEDARKTLGYEKINLLSRSYGTRVAYLFGLRYPGSIHRSLMISVNPPGHFVWEPGMVEAQLKYYAELWKKDPKAVVRTPDLLKTIRNVLDTLPKKWLIFNIDPDKVISLSFINLYHRDSAAQVFDAFVAAEKGDYSGLALVSFFYNKMLPKALNWGDNVSKAMSADYDPNRDYETEMMPPGSILGSPMSKILALMKYGGWPIKPIPGEYRQLQYSDVETLMVNGNIDFSTPVEYAKYELLPYLSKGKLVILKEMGHVSDVINLQPEAFRHLAETFYLKGVVDDSLFKYEPMDFTPSQSLPDMAKKFITRVALIGGGVIVVLIVIIVFLVRFAIRRKRRQRPHGMGLKA
jgi:pimeloyl-ACP methyl ester carboxylesterase